MIRPAKEYTAGKGDFVACDIENAEDGEIISINTAWREQGAICYSHFTDWGSWWDWLIKRAAEDRKFRVVYAHNGGGWDWVSLIAWLLDKGKQRRESIDIAAVGSKIVTCNVKVWKGFNLTLCDSLQLLRSSLDKLSQKFLAGRRKVDLGGRLPSQVFEEDPALFERYEREDVEILLLILEKALHLLRDKVAKIDTLGFTIGSTAMKVFRTIGITEPILIPWEPRLKELLRAAYTGGRVECFRPGVYPSVNVYDINSLYPYAMLTTEVPISDRGFWVDSGYEICPGDCGAFYVRFEQSRKDIPPVLCKGGEGVYSGEGHYFANELIFLKEIDPKATIYVIEGYAFFDKAKVFGPFVERLYNLRLSDPGGPVSELCKFLLNSLYGKFGQHPEREKVLSVNDFDELWALANCDDEDGGPRPLNEAAGIRLDSFGDRQKQNVDHLAAPVYAVKHHADCRFEHVGIAGAITSAARVALYRGMLAAGCERVIYVDTDSVHCMGSFPPNLVGPEIGRFKLEQSGEGAYAGKKLYALRWPKKNASDPGEKVRAKGVSVGGRNGCRLTYSDMRRIARGKSKVCIYRQPSTVLEVISGRKKSCVFVERKRTLQATSKGVHFDDRKLGFKPSEGHSRKRGERDRLSVG